MPGLRQTHTLAVMEVSESVFFLIRTHLKDAGYDHAILTEGDHELLDMSGIALREQAASPESSPT